MRAELSVGVGNGDTEPEPLRSPLRSNLASSRSKTGARSGCRPPRDPPRFLIQLQMPTTGHSHPANRATFLAAPSRANTFPRIAWGSRRTIRRAARLQRSALNPPSGYPGRAGVSTSWSMRNRAFLMGDWGWRSELWRGSREGNAQRGTDTGTDTQCPKALLALPLCAASVREIWSSWAEVVLLLLCLGLAFACGLRLGRPLGRFARSASTSIARHLAPFHKSIHIRRTIY